MPPRPRRPSRTPEEYVDLGIEAVLGLLEDEHAAVAPELEAKISEQPYGNLPLPTTLTTSPPRASCCGSPQRSQRTPAQPVVVGPSR